jgi:hypothetical protein
MRDELYLMNHEECERRETMHILKELFWPFPEVTIENHKK